MDHMVKMLEKYANNLEEIVQERTTQLEEEKKKTDLLLNRMLPKYNTIITDRNITLFITIVFVDIINNILDYNVQMCLAVTSIVWT